jgi:hypothetical protein
VKAYAPGAARADDFSVKRLPSRRLRLVSDRELAALELPAAAEPLAGPFLRRCRKLAAGRTAITLDDLFGSARKCSLAGEPLLTDQWTRE